MKSWTQTVISQYSNSGRLCALLEKIDEWISPDTNFEQFYDFIWNVDSAQGYGLDIWGRIVGVVRVVSLNQGAYFGYTGAIGPPIISSGDSYTAAPFYEGEDITTNFTLTDDAFRQLILAKAAANITNGSIQAINEILMNLFPNRGNAYVVDNLDMTMTYKFDFVLQPFEIAIVANSGVLPRSTGVTANAVYLT